MKAEISLLFAPDSGHRMKRIVYRVVIFIVLLVSLSVVGSAVDEVQAQGPLTCPALVEQALTELQSNCDELSRNSACYGYTLVDATFTEEVTADFFSEPADVAGLTTLETIQTAPLDISADQWGIAVMNAQANVPNTLPGQAVTFILMGDAQVENRVPLEEAQPAIEPINITVRADSVLRSQPTRSSNAADIMIGETEIPADAVDSTGEWVRVLYNNRPVWIALSEVVSAEGLDQLPVVTPESRSPMQAFYFSTGIGRPTCEEAPDAITIQGHEDMVVDLNLNGAEVHLGSVIVLRSISANQIVIMVIEGHLEIVETGEVIEGGQAIVALLDETGTIINWDAPRPWTPEEQAFIDIMQGLLDRLQNGGPLIHIVVRGDTLFSIAQQYDTSMPEILEINGLPPNGAVRIGQRLLIPNPGSGFVGLVLPTATPFPTQDVVDCSTLQPTSPLDGLAYGLNTFYWTPVAGATSYQVAVTNRDTQQQVFFPTVGPRTNVTALLDNATVGRGFNFSWNVQALVDGQPVCSSRSVVTQRASAPGQPTVPTTVPVPTTAPLPTTPPLPTATPIVPTATPIPTITPVPTRALPFTASWSCDVVTGIATITFANALPGEQITITFTDSGGTAPFTVSRSEVGPAATVTYNPAGISLSNGAVSGPTSGRVALLPTSITCTIL